MKTRSLALSALGLLGIFLVSPASAATDIVAATWQGQAYHGSDPYYGATINGFKTGSPATLTVVIDNTYNTNISITGARLHLDWNLNVSSSPSASASNPIPVNGQTVVTLTFSFQIPATTVASNLDRNGQGYNWYINWTGPYPSATTHPFYVDSAPDFGSGRIFVLSADQADALTAAQQLPESLQTATGSGSYQYCGVSFLGVTTGFRNAGANTLCIESQQQANLALNLYGQADFTGAKNAYQTALNDWNQALSADKSTGGGLELGQTVQGWGFLLLGIGAVVAGVGGIVYAFRRPKELRGMTAATH